MTDCKKAKPNPVTGPVHEELELNGKAAFPEIGQDNSKTPAPQQNSALRCPHCGTLLLRGEHLLNGGIECKPQLSLKTMVKMAISGAVGAVSGGTALAWLHNQPWFWEALAAIQLGFGM